MARYTNVWCLELYSTYSRNEGMEEDSDEYADEEEYEEYDAEEIVVRKLLVWTLIERASFQKTENYSISSPTLDSRGT